MATPSVVFWDVDTQVDFMLPGGKLYVPGAEKLIPKLDRLVDAARQGRVFLVSSTDAHTPDDPEFRRWPPHCVQGTPGQKKIRETLTGSLYTVPNRSGAELPADFRKMRQLILEKQTLDVFDNPNTEEVLKRLGRESEYCVFGVVTEYCVRCTVLGLLKRGYRVAVVTDAIETLSLDVGRRTVEEFVAGGARLITTSQALESLQARAAASPRTGAH